MFDVVHRPLSEGAALRGGLGAVSPRCFCRCFPEKEREKPQRSAVALSRAAASQVFFLPGPEELCSEERKANLCFPVPRNLAGKLAAFGVLLLYFCPAPMFRKIA